MADCNCLAQRDLIQRTMMIQCDFLHFVTSYDQEVEGFNQLIPSVYPATSPSIERPVYIYEDEPGRYLIHIYALGTL